MAAMKQKTYKEKTSDEGAFLIYRVADKKCNNYCVKHHA